MALMPPAVPPVAGSTVIDPSWIQAGSQVLSAAVQQAPAGPSRAQADTGGLFEFSAPFIVTTGEGDASLSQASSWVSLVIAGVVGLIGWSLWKKS